MDVWVRAFCAVAEIEMKGIKADDALALQALNKTIEYTGDLVRVPTSSVKKWTNTSGVSQPETAAAFIVLLVSLLWRPAHLGPRFADGPEEAANLTRSWVEGLRELQARQNQKSKAESEIEALNSAAGYGDEHQLRTSSLKLKPNTEPEFLTANEFWRRLRDDRGLPEHLQRVDSIKLDLSTDPGGLAGAADLALRGLRRYFKIPDEEIDADATDPTAAAIDGVAAPSDKDDFHSEDATDPSDQEQGSPRAPEGSGKKPEVVVPASAGKGHGSPRLTTVLVAMVAVIAAATLVAVVLALVAVIRSDSSANSSPASTSAPPTRTQPPATTTRPPATTAIPTPDTSRIPFPVLGTEDMSTASQDQVYTWVVAVNSDCRATRQERQQLFDLATQLLNGDLAAPDAIDGARTLAARVAGDENLTRELPTEQDALKLVQEPIDLFFAAEEPFRAAATDSYNADKFTSQILMGTGYLSQATQIVITMGAYECRLP